MMWIQIKGILGRNIVPDSTRHKSDSLAYYIEEIHWFNLIFVTAWIHLVAIQSNLVNHNETSEPLKLVYSGIMFASRILQLFFLTPLKDSRHKFKMIDNKVWIVFGIIELIGMCITATFTSYRGTTAATSIVEVFVFFG